MKIFPLNVVLVSLVLVCGVASDAAAQGAAWGVSASFTPRWSTPDGIKTIFLADEVSLEGRDFRVGVVRGRTQGGDWGISFVRQTMNAGGVVDAGGVRDVLEEDVQMTGAAFEYFGVFTTIKRRVQIGVATSFGAASVKGTARRNDSEMVEFNEVLKLGGYNTRVSPLVRVELALAVIAVQGFKLKVSGGFNYPGVSRLTVGGVFLFDR
jgi:hypothetical protein